MTGIWFTSDPHFGHSNVLKFCAKTRKYISIDEMDRAFIAKWNSQVAINDTVYILGDVFFHNTTQALQILQQLNGKKHLILGNHDRKFQNNAIILEQFESVTPYLTITIDEQYVVLFHYPIWEWDRMHYGAYHLHGHVHGNKMPIPGRILDVGVDTREDNGLWSWDEIHNILKDRPIRSHH